MSGNDTAGRLPRTEYMIASLILFILSIFFTICRLIIRLHYQKRLFVDDAFLIFAILCLIVSMALLFAFVSSMFLMEALVTNHPDIEIPSDFIEQVVRFQKLSSAFLVLTFTAIFAVKFSFLFLFKALIRNVRKIVAYWWTVVVITGVVWAFGVAEFFLPCPYFDGDRSLKCGQGSEYSKTLGWSAAIIVQDIGTDILIMVIPIHLLWHVQIQLRQKLALGVSLCLSIMMIISAIVQISGIHAPSHAIDVTWEIFWQLVEACIAVIMVSLTAFRSLFVAHGAAAQKLQNRHPNPERRNRLDSRRFWKKRVSDDSEETAGLPEIPRATMTGLRTFIRGERAEANVMRSEGSAEDEGSMSLEAEIADYRLPVENEVYSNS